MVTKRFTGRAYVVLWYGTVTLIIVAAVLMSLARLLLPMADDYRAQVEAWVSTQLGQPVHIKGMNARLLGTTPTLVFSDVELANGDSDAPRFSELHLGFDALASVRAGRPVLAELMLKGADITVERLKNGRLNVRGLAFSKSAGPETDAKAVGAWLSAHPALVIRASNLTWRDYTKAGKPITFSDVDIELKNNGARHQVDLTVNLPQELGRKLTVAADVEGELLDPSRLRGSVYVHTEQWRPASWVKDVPVGGWRLRNGVFDLKVWGQWQGEEITDLRGAVATRGLKLRGPGASLDFQELAGRLHWSEDEDGWHLELGDLIVAREGKRWKSRHVQAFGSRDRTVLRAKADRVDLEDAATVVRLIPSIPKEWLSTLSTAAPRGELQQVRISREGKRLRLQGDFRDLGMAPINAIPGFSGLDGHVVFDNDHGTLELKSRGVGIRAPRLFRHGLAFEHVEGRLQLRRTIGERWRLSSSQVSISNDDISGEGALTVALGGQDAPFLDLRGRFFDGRAASVSRYLPVRIMPPQAVKWVSGAFVSGRVEEGSVLFHGRPSDFPFANGEGQFKVHLKARGLVLNYKPGWPAVRDLGADVDFDGVALTAVARGGRIFRGKIRRAQVHIDDLKHPVLQLTGSVTAPLADLVRYVGESDLGRSYASTLSRFRTGGNGYLTLDLRKALHRGRTSSAEWVRGNLELRKGQLNLLPGLAVDGLVGVLHFDGPNFSSDGLRGRLFGEQVRLTVATEGEDELTTRIAARGAVSGEGVAHVWDSALGQHFSGRAEWQANLSLPHTNTGTGALLRFSSDLVGFGSSLPVPLNKPASARWPLQATVWFSGPRKGQARFSIENRLQAALELDPEFALQRAAVHFGAGNSQPLPKQAAVKFTGLLDGFSPSAWRDLLLADGSAATGRKLPVIVEMDRLRLLSKAGADETTAPSTGSGAPTDLPPLRVAIGSLSYDDMDFGRVGFRVSAEPDRLLLKNFLLEAPALRVSGEGHWKFQGVPAQCGLDLSIRTDNAGAAAKSFRVASVLTKGKGTAHLKVTWPGGPSEFALAKLDGVLGVDLHDGLIEEVDPGAGRLLGLLSLYALPRRLTLDFRDLFEKGMRFQSIKGSVRIVEGNAYTDDLRMKSIPASVLITGRTGLKARDFDQLITVVPEVSETLPLAGGLALGPQAGAVLFLFQQLFGQRIDEAAQFHYHVTGDWDDPVITRLAQQQN